MNAPEASRFGTIAGACVHLQARIAECHGQACCRRAVGNADPCPVPRLCAKVSRSVNASNGFLFCVTRDTSPKVRFKQTESRIWRRTALFEPRQISAACCVQSNSVVTNVPRVASTSPSWANASPTFARSAFSCVVLALYASSSTDPPRYALSRRSCMFASSDFRLVSISACRRL